MMREMTSPQLMEWIAYYTIEPFGEDRADIRAAITDITITAAAANRKKGAKLPKIEDFIPKFEAEEKSQTVDEMIQIAAAFTIAAGGKVGNDG